MNRRRFMALAAAAAAAPAIARAQTTTTTAECAIGFVNGLLQYAPDCALLTPPGLGAGIAPPSHLTMAGEAEEAVAEADAAAQAAAAEDEQRLLDRRDQKDDQKNRRRDRRRDQRGRTTNRQQDKRERRRARDDNERERQEAEAAKAVTCNDFASKAELDDFWAEWDDVATQLDFDGDGTPCEDIDWTEGPDPGDTPPAE